MRSGCRSALFGAVFDRGDLDPHLVELHAQPFLEAVGRVVAAAATGNERLDLLLDPELTQTRSALVEMSAHLGLVSVVDLPVEVEIDQSNDLDAVNVVRVSAAHRP